MVKLTPEIIEDAKILINPVQDRELCLRGYKIPVIENLGATYNQFDNLDLTDNDLRRLENFPLLPRLKCMFLSNNRISYLDPTVGSTIQNVRTIVLTNNSLSELGDLDPLATFPKLEYLSLMGCPVTHKPEYRLYVIHKLPTVRVLDFRRIRDVERQEAKQKFKGKKGKKLAQDLGVRTFAPGEMPPDATTTAAAEGNGVAPSKKQDVEKIKAAISNVKSLDDASRLQEMLAQGKIPGELEPASGNDENAPEVEEEEEDDDNAEDKDAADEGADNKSNHVNNQEMPASNGNQEDGGNQESESVGGETPMET